VIREVFRHLIEHREGVECERYRFILAGRSVARAAGFACGVHDAPRDLRNFRTSGAMRAAAAIPRVAELPRLRCWSAVSMARMARSDA
jgi:hypothetical protein